MKTFIFDPVNTSYSHASFNATMIEAIGKSKYSNQLTICLEENQIKLPVIQDAVNRLSLNLKVNGWKSINTKNSFQKFMSTFQHYYKIFQTIKKEKPDNIFFLAADNLFSPLLVFILKMQRKKAFNIFIILHNNIENIQDSTIKRKLWSLAFEKNTVGLVLADFVKEKAVLKFPNAKILTLEHPIYKHLSMSQFDQDTKEYKTDFLILGRHSNAFINNELSAKFFSACSELSRSKKITVAIKKDAVPNEKYSNVEIVSYGFPLKDEEYWELLHTSKFLVIPPESGKRVTASGVLADALTADLLIIAPNRGAFSEFIPSSYHDLLYNENEMERAISYALSLTDNAYKKKCHDVQKKADEYSLEKTIKKLNDILK